MKQQEKTQKTRERILAAALTEFGSKSYEAASVNSICEAGQVSKGLLYHNFKSKDELYLHCVGVCYDRMTACMKEHASQSRNPRERLQNFLMVRQQFFAENPGLANIFFNTVLYPPRQLTEELALLRRDFDAYLEEEYAQSWHRFLCGMGFQPIWHWNTLPWCRKCSTVTFRKKPGSAVISIL